MGEHLSTVQLRPYQEKALAMVHASTKKATLVVAPTGAGKGTMAVALMASFARRGKRVVFVVHRREILRDVVDRLARRGLAVAQTLHSDRKIRVVSVHTAMRAAILPVDLMIIDDAHHYAADEWKGITTSIESKRIVGFTATPQRADGRPLGDMFDELIDVVSYSALLRLGHIVPCRVLRPSWKMRNELARDPAEAYLTYARGLTALIYVRRVADAKHVTEVLRAAGVRAVTITGHTKKSVRDVALGQLERHEIDVIVNVGVLTEGVNVPHARCVVLARPCVHASTYVQIVGRVLRAAKGKDEALLIDLVGASHHHGLPAEDRVYALDGTGIGPVRPLWAVPERESPEPYITLELELEEVAARPVETPPEGALAARARKRNMKAGRTAGMGNAAFVPLTRSPPAAITPGFLFQSNGFWFLSWSQHGQKFRFGLATKEREVAERCLALFRQKGPDALRDEVRIRKRRAVSVWRHNERQWRIRHWNDDRTGLVHYKLYTGDEAEACAVRDLIAAGDFEEAHKRIDAIRERNLSTLSQRRAESRRRAYARAAEAAARDA